MPIIPAWIKSNFRSQAQLLYFASQSFVPFALFYFNLNLWLNGIYDGRCTHICPIYLKIHCSEIGALLFGGIINTLFQKPFYVFFLEKNSIDTIDSLNAAFFCIGSPATFFVWWKRLWLIYSIQRIAINSIWNIHGDIVAIALYFFLGFFLSFFLFSSLLSKMYFFIEVREK